MDPKYLEPLGLRALHVATSRAFGDEPLPRKGTRHNHTTGDLQRQIENGSLYRNLNFARVLVYVPQLWACWGTGVVWGVWLISSWLLVHFVLTLAELYRVAAAKALVPGAEEGPARPIAPIARASEPGWYFRPWPFETVKFYRALGQEQYGTFIIWIMTTVGRKRPEFLEAPDRRSLAQFEMTTRTSEIVHLVLFSSMAGVMVATFQAGVFGPAAWSCVVTWGDFNLVLLQRYHRVRAWPLLKRARERAE